MKKKKQEDKKMDKKIEKKEYIPPTIEVTYVEMEQGIAAGSTKEEENSAIKPNPDKGSWEGEDNVDITTI